MIEFLLFKDAWRVAILSYIVTTIDVSLMRDIVVICLSFWQKPPIEQLILC